MKDMSVTVRFTAEAEGELAVANRVRSRLLSARSLPVAAFGKVLLCNPFRGSFQYFSSCTQAYKHLQDKSLKR